MRVQIRKIAKKEEEHVLISCVEITQDVQDIKAYAEHKGMELSGMAGDHLVRFQLSDVYYFEALDEKVFAYQKEQVCEVKMRLYEAERSYEPYHFVRCSKSVLLNLMKLESISPALNGRFFAHMENGEKLIISRQYAPKIKEIVMGGVSREK